MDTSNASSSDSQMSAIGETKRVKIQIMESTQQQQQQDQNNLQSQQTIGTQLFLLK